MTELLAPAGDMMALKAGIAAGADAVYLGMKSFGARAYSDNFDRDNLKEAVSYAHIRGVKVYVTVNTIVFEDEFEEVKETLQFLNQVGVDGVIVQDLGVFRYATETFQDMEVHCSTQMGIDDLEGALLCKELGAKRIVLAREADIAKVKEIKEKAKIPVEIFVHGALCISYSGNCLMSGLIGYRSGNRGRCVGSCRKPYELYDEAAGKTLGISYILSTKDLNTIDHIEELKVADSLKIEGRMKEPSYVSNVVSKYRLALDGKMAEADKEGLEKTFNRTYTQGYLFGEDKKDITNIDRPNNYGYEIGQISGQFKGMWEIQLRRQLSQQDIIRIDHGGEDVNLSVVKLYDRDGMLISGAKPGEKCYIKIKEQLSRGDKVYKTKDYEYYKDIERDMDKEHRRFPLDMQVYGYPEAKLVVEAQGLGVSASYESEQVLSAAINNPTTEEQVLKQLDRLGDTVFTLGQVDYEENGAFIPAKELNKARRQIVEALYEAKAGEGQRRLKTAGGEEAEAGEGSGKQGTPAAGGKITFPVKKPYITAAVTNLEQYQACREAGVDEIYFENIVPRNQNHYEDREGTLLIGGMGGIKRYRESNDFVTDYSLNVVNAKACHELFKQGAKRVTLSYEMNKKQIKDLVASYYEKNQGYPALEMIVYGRAPLMVTKYCPLKKMDLCSKCQKGRYILRDEYGQFPVLTKKDPKCQDCLTTILNGKVLNLLDEMPSIEGVEAFRLNFTLESGKEVGAICKKAMAKLEGRSGETLFDQATDTRGHFNKEIL